MTLDQPSIDPLLPPAMLEKAEQVGQKKSALSSLSLWLLAILAGVFIAIGAVFMVTVTTGGKDLLGYGLTKLLGGLAFSTGLIMVVVGGAELFTGNMLMIIAAAGRKISFGALMRNWAVVYVGNFIGSLLVAALVIAGGWARSGAGAVGLNLLQIGEAKSSLAFLPAIALGILCNLLVCMAVWLCYSARSTTDKILSIILPITAFVAAGFEHSVANMFFLPAALLLKDFGGASFFDLVGMSPADFPHLTWGNFLLHNLLPVTIGNMIGGAVVVGLVYWLIYRKKA
jgi:formate transporter FocA